MVKIGKHIYTARLVASVLLLESLMTCLGSGAVTSDIEIFQDWLGEPLRIPKSIGGLSHIEQIFSQVSWNNPRKKRNLPYCCPGTSHEFCERSGGPVNKLGSAGVFAWSAGEFIGVLHYPWESCEVLAMSWATFRRPGRINRSPINMCGTNRRSLFGTHNLAHVA